MLFYILIGAVAVIAIGVGIHFFLEDEKISSGVIGFFGGACFSGIVAVIIIGITVSLPAPAISSESHKYELRALGTSSAIEGSVRGGIFLTTGYINQQQVFSYLREENGGMVLRQAYANEAVVYEGAATPTVEFTTYTFGRPMLYPWTTTENREFIFRVPDGSVSNEIAVTP